VTVTNADEDMGFGKLLMIFLTLRSSSEGFVTFSRTNCCVESSEELRKTEAPAKILKIKEEEFERRRSIFIFTF